jgi:hypothetical protein
MSPLTLKVANTLGSSFPQGRRVWIVSGRWQGMEAEVVESLGYMEVILANLTNGKGRHVFRPYELSLERPTNVPPIPPESMEPHDGCVPDAG